MPGIQRFEDILAWQKGRELVRAVYALTRETPLKSDFALRDQIQRAAISVMTNIAEGFGRNGNKEFAHFLDTARGSALEVQSLLYVALDAQYVDRERFCKLYDLTVETIALITALTSYLRTHSYSSPDARTVNSESRN